MSKGCCNVFVVVVLLPAVMFQVTRVLRSVQTSPAEDASHNLQCSAFRKDHFSSGLVVFGSHCWDRSVHIELHVFISNKIRAPQGFVAIQVVRSCWLKVKYLVFQVGALSPMDLVGLSQSYGALLLFWGVNTSFPNWSCGMEIPWRSFPTGRTLRWETIPSSSERVLFSRLRIQLLNECSLSRLSLQRKELV